MGRALVCFALLGLIGTPVSAERAVRISLGLDKHSSVTHLSAGDSAGIAPAIARVHVGDTIVFVNDDAGTHHTATGLRGTHFGEPRWTDAALKQYGAIGADDWSTGDLAPGASSAPLRVTQPGTYLYGCFFHYSAGMRGEIIVEP